jgi:hypothetical protein
MMNGIQPLPQIPKKPPVPPCPSLADRKKKLVDDMYSRLPVKYRRTRFDFDCWYYQQQPTTAGTTAPRTRRHFPQRSVESSHYWQTYVCDIRASKIREDEINCSVTDKRNDAYRFRQQFRVPYSLFEKLIQINITKQWYKPTSNGRPRSDIRLLMLACLNILGNGSKFHNEMSYTNISTEVIRNFFHEWCKNMYDIRSEYIYMPSNKVRCTCSSMEPDSGFG